MTKRAIWKQRNQMWVGIVVRVAYDHGTEGIKVYSPGVKSADMINIDVKGSKAYTK